MTNSGPAAPVSPPAAPQPAATGAVQAARDPSEGSSARPVRDVFEAQVAMARLGISAGSIDGALGSQTRAALRTFQRRVGLAQTGALDGDTRAALRIAPPVLTSHTVTSNDLARLLPVASTWLGKSEQPRLDYETLLEYLAEKAHAHPLTIRRLNPGIDWDNVPVGAVVSIPSVDYPPPQSRAACVKISLSNKALEAFDASSNVLAHFPCSIGRVAEKRPVGALSVLLTAPNPNYTFNPDIFPESEEGRRLGRKLVLPPGPNNPVGTAWIGLDRPGYGIHGTPWPELVGRTESHGCFRLANWNAEYLLKLVAPGTPVLIEP